MAELADALASGASVRKNVGVQVPPRAQIGPDRHSTECGSGLLFLDDLRFAPAASRSHPVNDHSAVMGRWALLEAVDVFQGSVHLTFA